MRLIVGLGNPETKYQNTYHNLGFSAIEKIAEKLGVSFGKTKCQADICEFGLGKSKVILAKPLTYMNLSGKAVRELADFYKISLEDILIIYDDVDMDKGLIRIRENGSAGTHNGMKSIIGELGTCSFSRLRIGFKPDPDNKIPLIDLVLSKIKDKDIELISKGIEKAVDAGVCFAKGEGIQSIMQKYNGK